METHISVDKLVYTAGEYIFVTAYASDPFTKIPSNIGWDPYPYVKNYLYFDVQDAYGNIVDSTWEWMYGSGTGAMLWLDTDSYSSTYTIRVYGPSYASSYKQVRVLGQRDFFSDFPVFATTNTSVYQPGDTVKVTYTLPYGFGYQGLKVESSLYSMFENN